MSKSNRRYSETKTESPIEEVVSTAEETATPNEPVVAEPVEANVEEAAKPKKVKVTCDRLNVRLEKDMKSGIANVVSKGDVLTAAGPVEGAWQPIKVAGIPETCYVMAKFVEEV
jgi:hypothetical protein